MLDKINKLVMPTGIILNRYKRFFRHLLFPVYKFKDHLPSKNIIEWIIDLLFYFGDLFFIAEVFILSNLLLKRGIRKMNDAEKLIARNVFNNTILYDNVFIDDNASFLVKKHKFAYVSFNLINSWGSIRDDIFIHELMHVYQFQKFGFVYVYRALKAQFSREGYDYGGPKGLLKAKEQGKTLFEFNFEQQASIIEHYYAIRQSKEVLLTDVAKEIYSHYAQQLQNG